MGLLLPLLPSTTCSPNTPSTVPYSKGQDVGEVNLGWGTAPLGQLGSAGGNQPGEAFLLSASQVGLGGIWQVVEEWGRAVWASTGGETEQGEMG